MKKDDPLSRLHWDALCAQHADPNSERTKKAIADYNQALDEWLDILFKPMMASLDEIDQPMAPDAIKKIETARIMRDEAVGVLTCRCLHTQAWHKHDPNSDRCHYYHCECKHFDLIHIESAPATNAPLNLTLEALLQMAQSLPQVPPLPCPQSLRRPSPDLRITQEGFACTGPGFNVHCHASTGIQRH